MPASKRADSPGNSCFDRGASYGFVVLTFRELLNGFHRTLEGVGFDSRFVDGSVIDTGAQGQRALDIAKRLNAVRDGLDKQPVVVWKMPEHAAVTVRGRYVYISMTLAQRLSDDGLAFVIAHEMAHHDLGHVANPLGTLAALSFGADAELHADRRALEVTSKAGFDPRGGVEALHPDLWDAEPEPPPREGFLGKLDRWRRSHPPTAERLAAIERWIADNA